MQLLIDCHAHLYPCFSLDSALDAAWDNFQAQTQLLEIDSATKRTYALVLCERSDCHYFAMASQSQEHGAWPSTRWKPTTLAPQCCVELQRDDGATMLLFAGRQYNTAERLEILALGKETNLADGLSFHEAHSEIRAQGALPVLNWALGKWMFGRRAIVASLLEEFSPESLFLGDTTLRPQSLPEPGLLRHAREKGYFVFAGSDPLPFASEAKLLGSFGLAAELSTFTPAELLAALPKASRVETFGLRSGVNKVALRNARWQKEKRRSN